MAKTKISEFDIDPSNNTDINSINIAEGCAPSGINNAIRQLMSDLKEQQTGASGDNFTVGGNLAVTGTSAFTGAVTLTGGIVGGGFIPTGGIIIWSGASAAIPTGWLLCNGTSGTPDLRDRFVVGAGSSYAVGATGGANTATTGSSGAGSTSTVSVTVSRDGWGTSGGNLNSSTSVQSGRIVVGSGSVETYETLESLRSSGNDITTGSHSHTISDHTHTVDTRSPYYALCYIMKA